MNCHLISSENSINCIFAPFSQMIRLTTIYFIATLTFAVGEVSFNKTCGNQCCDGSYWNKTLNMCIDCEIGYYGVLCSLKCFPPTYGKDCQNICACDYTQYCHFAVGCSSNKSDEKEQYEYQHNYTGTKQDPSTVIESTDYATPTTSICTSKYENSGMNTRGYLLYAVITVVTLLMVLSTVYFSTYIYEKITKARDSLPEDNAENVYENQNGIELQTLQSNN